MITVTRYHDISAGHRVANHEGKCKHLHGHNYRIHFEVYGEQDYQGRVIDFGVIKECLCMWLEDRWDHKMLMWENDPMLPSLHLAIGLDDIVKLPFNPTAENMAKHLVTVVGPAVLQGTGCVLVKCIVEETRKCSATYVLEEWQYPSLFHMREFRDAAAVSPLSAQEKAANLELSELPF